jgi:hypothetical protein
MSLEDQIASVIKSPFVPSFFGAYISLKFVPGLTFFERAFNLSSGCLLGGYLAPGIADWFGLESQRVVAVVAVLVGLFGLNLTDAVMQWIKIFTATVADWLSKLSISDFIPWWRKK